MRHEEDGPTNCRIDTYLATHDTLISSFGEENRVALMSQIFARTVR
jgi:hypothetical protein